MLKDLLCCVMDIAEQMLICGAEIYRVEDSVNRIFYSYGVKRVDTFIISPSIVVSVCDNDGEVITQTRRVGNTSTDIEKLHKLNDLSRYICNAKPSIEEIKVKINELNQSKKYPFLLKILANAVIAGSFTLFFGGNLIEGVVSFVIGGLMQYFISLFSKIKINKLFEKLFCSILVSVLAFISVKLSVVGTVDKIIIGNIMYLIPGVALTNSIRDLFKGDIFTGIYRAIESVIIAITIAAGYVLVTILIGGSAI